MEAATPKQVLSLGDATAIIVGLIVGAGIFGTPSIVAGAVESPALVVAVWIAGGLFAIVGALCYAELATAFPSAGGEYHFIARAYGRPLAFLYGWARMTVIVAGSIAVFAYLFGDYMSRVIKLGPYSSAIWAVLIVVVLTFVNAMGIREGKLTQKIFTFLEVGGLVLIVVVGLFLAPEPAPAQRAARTREVDLARHAPADEARVGARLDHAAQLVPEHAREPHVALGDFEIGAADPRHRHADQRFARTRRRRRDVAQRERPVLQAQRLHEPESNKRTRARRSQFA